MIEVTRMNGTRLIVNAELIEAVEETPDTVLTLTSGKKIIVQEDSRQIRDAVIQFKREIFIK